MAPICSGWPTRSHSLTAALYCLFKILKEKSIEKDKCLKKVCVPWWEAGSVTKCNSAHQSIVSGTNCPDPWFVAAPGSPLLPSASKAGLAGRRREKEGIYLIYLSGCARTELRHSRIPNFPVPCGLLVAARGIHLLTRDRTWVPRAGVRRPSHSTTREVRALAI